MPRDGDHPLFGALRPLHGLPPCQRLHLGTLERPEILRRLPQKRPGGILRRHPRIGFTQKLQARQQIGRPPRILRRHGDHRRTLIHDEGIEPREIDRLAQQRQTLLVIDLPVEIAPRMQVAKGRPRHQRLLTLQQRHLHPLTSQKQCRRHSGHPSPDDHDTLFCHFPSLVIHFHRYISQSGPSAPKPNTQNLTP